MGSAASSGRTVRRASSAPPHGHPQAMLLVNGSARRAPTRSLNRTLSSGDVGVDLGAMRKIDQRRKSTGAASYEEIQTTSRDADPATLHILNAVKQVDALPDNKAALKLQLLRDCYPFLEQAPAYRFDQLAVLVYQKEGDVYFDQGDAKNAKTTYSRAIQIAETRVARGEKEIYMVLKRYVLAMVGMARLWYEQERETTGFTLAAKRLPSMAPQEDSEGSLSSRASSVLSDASMFSLNQEILKSMAPKSPRCRTGPAVNVVRLLRPSTMKVQFTAEDDFVLRSKMTRELKASPCELLLLRCIEVVEIGHRRQSELLIPALIELAQIYEDLRLYNRSLLLVRRCLGILSVVYDYDHPWIIQLRRRADYLMVCMEEKKKEDMAAKIQATWKMYKAMRFLEEALGRPVTRHVWIPTAYQSQAPDTDFLDDFVNDLPEGTVLYGTGDAGEPLNEGDEMDESKVAGDGPHSISSVHPPQGPLSEESIRLHSTELRVGERQRSSLRRSTKVMSESDQPFSGHPKEAYDQAPLAGVYSPVQQEDHANINTTFVPNGRVIGTLQDTQTDTQVQQTSYGGVLTIRTTTVTRTITEREVGSDEEDSIDEEEEYQAENGMRGSEACNGSPYDKHRELEPRKEHSRSAGLQSVTRSVGDTEAVKLPRVQGASSRPPPSPPSLSPGRMGNNQLLPRYGLTTNESSTWLNGVAPHTGAAAPAEPGVSPQHSMQDTGSRMRVWKANLGG